MEKKKKLYPDSHVELEEFIAKNYDTLLNIGTLGIYKSFIKRVIHHMDIQPGDHILDLGCGTGRNARLMCRYLNANGHITGMDISEHMEMQFRRKFEKDKRVEFIKQRIDQLFNLHKVYDKVFISFVIHGFPHEVRDSVIENAFNHLNPGGSFFILDYAEFDMDKMPWFHRLIFKTIECKYAYDFITHDWKAILATHHFQDFRELFYLKNYIRLLRAVRL
jgi:ubiquinone/menaquinone biosynthesis C-methylase UbiE